MYAAKTNQKRKFRLIYITSVPWCCSLMVRGGPACLHHRIGRRYALVFAYQNVASDCTKSSLPARNGSCNLCLAVYMFYHRNLQWPICHSFQQAGFVLSMLKHRLYGKYHYYIYIIHPSPGMSLSPASYPEGVGGSRWGGMNIIIGKHSEQNSLLPGVQIWASSISKMLFFSDEEHHQSTAGFAS